VGSSYFCWFVEEAFKNALFFKKKKTNTKRKRIEKEVEDPGGAVSPAARKRRQSVQSPEVQEKTNKLYERQQYDEMVAKACLLKRVKDSYKE
jgi:hypothetical protein